MPDDERELITDAGISRAVDFGREICGDLAVAEEREWLVTNGIGGFACGTVAGTLTRRYHGFLVAALRPPSERTLLVSKFDEVVDYNGSLYPLSANRWAGGVIDPQGQVNLERFRLEGAVPVWTYALADALLEKRVWMDHGSNTTYVEYRVIRAQSPLKLTAKALVNYRGYHCLTCAGSWHMTVEPVPGGIRVQPHAQAESFCLLSAEASVEVANVWYCGFDLPAEKARGLDHQEDHLHACSFHAELKPGTPVTLVASTRSDASADGQFALMTLGARELALSRACARAHPNWLEWPRWIKQLVLAADQFVVSRLAPESPQAGSHIQTSPDAPRGGVSIIAGYPWFTDWGRDTMIALPGLLLATGRAEIAAVVLRTYARYVDRGMLPNYFPDGKCDPEYNTVDAALWFFAAVRQYYAITHDVALVREIFPALSQIIDGYTHGTRFNIHVDSADGLVFAGEPGSQLTWMDARVDGHAVTPRMGKPIEVNALWLNALTTQAMLAEAVGQPSSAYKEAAARVSRSFERFWNAAANCCFDVIDGPHGNDASLRPNQILAVAIDDSPLTANQQRAVVDVCARELLTSFGLRSLARGSHDYCGQYTGDSRQRDSAYHQGTVWGWLMGPFIDAFMRVTGDRERAVSFLAPFENHLKIHGLGTASEIFEGDAPFAPRGCFAQAWTVAEILRAWVCITRK